MNEVKSEASALTRYRMLRSVDGGGTWTLEGTQDAYNGDAAAKKMFGVVDEGVQVVAIPNRSWKPLGRKVVESYTNAPVDPVPPQDPLPLSFDLTGSAAMLPDPLEEEDR